MRNCKEIWMEEREDLAQRVLSDLCCHQIMTYDRTVLSRTLFMTEYSSVVQFYERKMMGILYLIKAS